MAQGQLSLLRALPRGRWLGPLLLGILVQLYRWWLQRRARSKQQLESNRPKEGAAASLQVGERSHPGLAPPPRPGVDPDERFEQLEDDPRYFDGAELGKAQRAALGQLENPGGFLNTVSYDPASMLVAPSMRVLHGQAQSAGYSESLQPEDFVAVADFFCAAGDSDMYGKLIAEMQRVSILNEHGIATLRTYDEVVSRICRYFLIPRANSTSCISWHTADGAGQPCQTSSPDYEAREAKGDYAFAVTVFFGGELEMLLWKRVHEDHLSIPCSSGSLYLMGAGVLSTWSREICATNTGAGVIAITVLGSSIAAPGLNLGQRPLKAQVDVLFAPTQQRPSMRIITGLQDVRGLKSIRHDDVIVLPEYFCCKDDWEVYYALLREMRERQAEGVKNAEWASWHEGAHLLTKNPKGSHTFEGVLDGICNEFHIANGSRRNSVSSDSVGTRFNWYRDGSDWKPFHHDSAAFNLQRAMNQNCTVGVSFGASRELAFRHAKTGDLVYFPQTNGMLFFFGRDVNIRWQHGINALPEEQQDGKGRVSIILWGLCALAVDEPGSPPMLEDSHSQKGSQKGKGKGKRKGFDRRGERAGAFCINFQRGFCSFGESCKYLHSIAAAGA